MSETVSPIRYFLLQCDERRRCLSKRFIVFLVGMVVLGIPAGYAQPIYEWSEKQIIVGWQNPTFDRDLEYNPITSSAYMNVSWPLDKNNVVQGILPWIHYQRPDNRASLIGNPSFGWQHKPDGPFIYRLDVTFPLVRDTTGEAAFVGSRIHYPTRQQFVHKAWTMQGGVGYRKGIYKDWLILLHGDLQTVAYNQFRNVDVLVDYVLKLRREQRQIHYDVSWHGSLAIAGSTVTPGDEWGHLIQVGFGFKTALVDPRLYVTVPLNASLNRDVDYVMGIAITADMGKLRWPGDF